MFSDLEEGDEDRLVNGDDGLQKEFGAIDGAETGIYFHCIFMHVTGLSGQLLNN